MTHKAGPPVSQLLAHHRLSGEAWHLGLLLYAPVGVLLFCLRLVVAVHAFLISCALPTTSPLRRVVLRGMCCVLGLTVKEEGAPDAEAKVLAANHVSPLDFTAVCLLRPCVLPNVWELPRLLQWAFGYVELGARSGREAFVHRATEYARDSPIPLLAFPEGAMSSGAVGLLRFGDWPFALHAPVQPLLLKVARPFPVAPTVVGSRWWTDMFWFLFLPYSVFTIRWLETQRLGHGEAASVMARRTAALVAKEGGLVATNHSGAEAVAYAKRYLRDREAGRQRKAQPRTPRTGQQLDGMALKVKETFPQVPLSVIRKDLEKTESVETTATNILEGRLQFSPESINSAPMSKKPSDPGCWRQMLDERKWALIEENRRRYLLRHGRPE